MKKLIMHSPNFAEDNSTKEFCTKLANHRSLRVFPSIAIREGVYKSPDSLKELK
jgi:hypothetical protein